METNGDNVIPTSPTPAVGAKTPAECGVAHFEGDCRLDPTYAERHVTGGYVPQRDYDALAAKLDDYDAAWDAIMSRPMIGESRENNWAQDGTLAMNVRHVIHDLTDMHASLATSEAARETYRLQAEGAERERDAAKAEAAQAHAVVARLPKTADGVPWVDGDLVFCPKGHPCPTAADGMPWCDVCAHDAMSAGAATSLKSATAPAPPPSPPPQRCRTTAPPPGLRRGRTPGRGSVRLARKERNHEILPDERRVRVYRRQAATDANLHPVFLVRPSHLPAGKRMAAQIPEERRATMSKLFQITEDDLAELERLTPELQEALAREMARPEGANRIRVQLRRIKEILSNVRWYYGPPSEVKIIEVPPTEEPS
jgi:hypothetical protein